MGAEVVPVSFTTFVLVGAAVWLAIGLILSLVMGRRGHDAFAWLIMGTLFGPLGAIFALQARTEERVRPEVVVPGLSRGSGPVDVLVGLDDSPESAAALRAALHLLGPRLGRLTLATVVPFHDGPENERATTAALKRQAEAVGGGPELELFHGRPGPVLLQQASEGGYDLLVIGTRGKGASTALLGSTAVDIAEWAKVPVLIMGAGGISATEP